MTFEEATALHKQGKLDMARDAYEELMARDYDNPKLLYLLGTVYLQRKNVGVAANLFMRCLSFNKNYFEAWNNLGNCYSISHMEKDAKACWEEALKCPKVHPADAADVYNNLGSLHINAGTPEDGMKYIDKALENHPTHNDANWNKALLLLEQGKFAEGFDQYKWGFKTMSRVVREYGGQSKYWEGQPVDKIVVYGEQGMGDEILFASMIEDLKKKCKHVIFDCHPKLETLFKASFPDIKVYGTRKDSYINWVHSELPIDAMVSIGDLGRFFRRSLEDFPRDRRSYLKADPERVKHYKDKLDKMSNRMKIGLSWWGGTHKTRNDYRSINPIDLEPILRQDADFISLQYTPQAYLEVAEVKDKFDLDIHHWPYSVTEGVRFHYHETAALVEALDLVLTVNTSIHHLAGAMGKNTWTFTPKAKAWRYWSPDGMSTPWYPSVRLIEQKGQGDWKPIIEGVADQLKEKIERRKNENK